MVLRLFRRSIFSIILLLCLCLALPSVSASPIPLRGVVEGFYGTPWTHAQRLDMLAFMGRQGFNAYIYSPKDDQYARAAWREPYPAAQRRELGELVRQADQAGVQFIYALSPGLDSHFTGPGREADLQAAEAKLESMYALGVRRFAVFFDDIKNKDAAGQTAFINALSRTLRTRHRDVQTFLTVPVEYYYADMQQEDVAKPYTKVFAAQLQPDIQVLYTGDGVVVPALTQQELQRAETLYGRKLGIWWNYPVTDYLPAKLALGPIGNLPQRDANAIFFNPMQYPELSKIALATGAVYAKEPEKYEPEQAWRQAIAAQYGDLAEDMALFAGATQHMENAWAKVGPQDDQVLQQAIAQWQAEWPQGGEAAERSRLSLDAQLQRRLTACERLQRALPQANPEAYKECEPQLMQWHGLCETARLGLQLLAPEHQGVPVMQRKVQRSQFQNQCRHLADEQAHAVIGDTTLVPLLAYINRTLLRI